MSFAQVEKAVADFAARARENKLKPDELQSGTFTVTNGGVYGSLLSTPIVKPFLKAAFWECTPSRNAQWPARGPLLFVQ